ncbi:sugar-binding protein [Thalassomonas sp. M1454]|uniref:sugar-binding protein n=1 Tax=Thalassomonas sp. M1454 TaxID=2594477 RepID=UPI00117C7F5C|nr:sugar-binding protein [Thalassomonas sp. M1454]TRX53842.1 sugar-binding protein [Thalassomonas sp. M1454]
MAFSKKLLSTLIPAALLCATSANSNEDVISVPVATQAITIDGIANDSAWSASTWLPIDQHMIGEYPSKEDFSGRFKLLWDKDYLYLLAEITDDVLIDKIADPLDRYWDDDCLEIFLDEDASGGNHQFDFNAFAYHVALDNQVADIGPNNTDGSTNFILLNDHVNSVWKRDTNAPHKVYWELAIKIFDDSFTLPSNNPENIPVKLSADKTMGFMLAYCDNDASVEREHFLGSHKITPVNGDKNLGYIDASVFGKIKLVK